jgi:hypothetical protein
VLSQLAALAEQIKLDLIAASAANAFVMPLKSVTRKYYVAQKVDDLDDGAHVTIGHSADDGERADNGGLFQRDLILQIAVRSKIKIEYPTTELDNLLKLVEQLADYYVDRIPTGRSEAMMAVDMVALYDPDDLQNHKVFTSVFALTFRGWR